MPCEVTVSDILFLFFPPHQSTQDEFTLSSVWFSRPYVYVIIFM